MASQFFQLVEVSDLRKHTRSYKVYRRGRAGKDAPVAAGIYSRAEAEAKIVELEQQAMAAQKKAQP